MSATATSSLLFRYNVSGGTPLLRGAAIAALALLVVVPFAQGAALIVGSSAFATIALIAAAGALVVAGLTLLTGGNRAAKLPADVPSRAEIGALSQTAELSRHLETVLAALLDLRSDNALLRDELTRTVGLVQRGNRLASVGLLTAGLAHEMRNPLVALRTFAQLLPQRWDDGDFRREFAEVVLSELDRVGRLMTDLLLFARDQNGCFEVSSVEDVLATVVPLLRAQAADKHVTIELAVDASAPRITANVAQLRQVVMNLGLNALEATPAGGRVRIVASGGADSPVATVRVIDSGPGIAPENVARIFDPFFTTRADGTGLGLPISRDIIERHGGRLAVESAPGAGATFAIELPAVASDFATNGSGRRADAPVHLRLAH